MIRVVIMLATIGMSFAWNHTVRAQNWIYESQPGGLPPMAYHGSVVPEYRPSLDYGQPTYQAPQIDNIYRGLPIVRPSEIGPPASGDDD